MSIFGMIGSIIGAKKGEQAASKDRTMQYWAAQNAIQAKVADAKKAGVHPLYALGSQPISMSPVGDGGAGAMYAEAGQNLDRAIEANRTRQERVMDQARAGFDVAQQREMNQLNIEHQRLRNVALASDIARLQADQVGPPAPVDNMSPDPRFQPLPAESRMESSFMQGREAGHVAELRYARTPRGGLTLMRPHDLTESLEDDWVGGIQWDLRNRLMPNFDSRAMTPSTREYPLPRGQVWRWSTLDQAFFPYDPSRREFIKDGRRSGWEPRSWFDGR